jgi:hypothetical protein
MFPTPDEIASRAHALFVLDDRHLTKISEYWRRAEQELLDRGARRSWRARAGHRAAVRANRSANSSRIFTRSCRAAFAFISTLDSCGGERIEERR